MAKRLSAEERHCRARGWHNWGLVAETYEEAESRGRPSFISESVRCEDCYHRPEGDELSIMILDELGLVRSVTYQDASGKTYTESYR